MSLDPQGAVFSRLTSQTSLTDLLGTYNSAPAVFSSYAPSDHLPAAQPTVIVDPPTLNEQADTFNADYRNATLNVRLFARVDGSSSALYAAAEQARTVLKSWPDQVIEGATYHFVDVTGPIGAPTTDPAVDGLLLTVRLLIQE